MPGELSLTAARLSGLFCETLFYGVFLVTCAFVARTLLLVRVGKEERWARLSEIRWVFAIVAIILFVIQTFNIALGLLQNFDAFVYSDNPDKALRNNSNWISVTRALTQNIVMMIGDTVLIYRCWIVHGRRWLVVTPSLLLYMGCLAMTFWIMQLEAEVVNPNAPLSSSDFRNNLLAFTALTAAQNILTTSLLIWRIWRVEKESENCMDLSGSIINRPRPLRRAMRVIAESGAIYTLSDLVTFIVIARGSYAMYPAAEITIQLTGITFNVILIRSSPSRDQQFTHFDQSDHMVYAPHAGSTIMGSTSVMPQESKHRGIEVAIHVDSSHRDTTDQTSHSDRSETSGDVKPVEVGTKF